MLKAAMCELYEDLIVLLESHDVDGMECIPICYAKAMAGRKLDDEEARYALQGFLIIARLKKEGKANE